MPIGISREQVTDTIFLVTGLFLLVLDGMGRERAGSIYEIAEVWLKALSGVKRIEMLMTGQGN